MSVAAKPLISAQFAPAAEATLYTASGVRTIIDKFVGYNSSAAAVVLTVRIVIVGGTAGVSNTLIVKSLAVCGPRGGDRTARHPATPDVPASPAGGIGGIGRRPHAGAGIQGWASGCGC